MPGYVYGIRLTKHDWNDNEYTDYKVFTSKRKAEAFANEYCKTPETVIDSFRICDGDFIFENKFTQFFDNQTLMRISHEFIFKEWHDEEYLTICYYNLLEKYRCGGIPREEFKPIYILKTGGKINESTSGN